VGFCGLTCSTTLLGGGIFQTVKSCIPVNLFFHECSKCCGSQFALRSSCPRSLPSESIDRAVLHMGQGSSVQLAGKAGQTEGRRLCSKHRTHG